MIVPPGRCGCPASLVLLMAVLAAAPAAQFRGGVDLVEVYATVVDGEGRPVTGLGVSDFTVAEDGRPQSVAAFVEADVPLAVAVAVDHSFSVPASRLSQVVAAAETFLAALRPADEVMIVGIGSRTEVLTPLTLDRPTALSALRGLSPWGSTPLYDAVVEAVTRVDGASGRRALVLLSDGVDRYSRTTATGMVAEVRQRNVLVYPIIVGSNAPSALAEAARATGGRLLTAPNPDVLQARVAVLADELRAQYLLGYSSDAEPVDTPTWRSIRVTVSRPGVTVRARDGYLAR